jgi:hypothetical protein
MAGGNMNDRYCPKWYSPDNSACINYLRRGNAECIECKNKCIEAMSKASRQKGKKNGSKN